MRYWDASALIAIIVDESHTEKCEHWLRSDPQIATWWLSRVECASALNRLRREEVITEEELRVVLNDLTAIADTFAEILPTEMVRSVAMRLLRVHELRAADALQLAAAILAAGEERGALEFVSFDTRLLLAAEREGLVGLC